MRLFLGCTCFLLSLPPNRTGALGNRLGRKGIPRKVREKREKVIICPGKKRRRTTDRHNAALAIVIQNEERKSLIDRTRMRGREEVSTIDNCSLCLFPPPPGNKSNDDESASSAPFPFIILSLPTRPRPSLASRIHSWVRRMEVLTVKDTMISSQSLLCVSCRRLKPIYP